MTKSLLFYDKIFFFSDGLHTQAFEGGRGRHDLLKDFSGPNAPFHRRHNT